jgi:hypothetical protein
MPEIAQNGTTSTKAPSFLSEEVSNIGFFSPHHMSHEQVQEIEEMTGRTMADIEDLSDLADRHIDTHQNIDRVWSSLSDRLEEMLEDAETVVLFGVFPPPIRAKFLQWSTRRKPTNVHLFESFNSRGKGSGRGPDFNHIEWVETGQYDLKSPST